MASNCPGCGTKTTAMYLCRHCKSENHRLHVYAKKQNWLMDTAGGAIWVWDALGNVLAGPCKGHFEALKEAEAYGDNDEIFTECCPMCNGDLEELGALGALHHFRCKNCGMNVSK